MDECSAMAAPDQDVEACAASACAAGAELDLKSREKKMQKYLLEDRIRHCLHVAAHICRGKVR